MGKWKLKATLILTCTGNFLPDLEGNWEMNRSPLADLAELLVESSYLLRYLGKISRILFQIYLHYLDS